MPKRNHKARKGNFVEANPPPNDKRNTLPPSATMKDTEFIQEMKKLQQSGPWLSAARDRHRSKGEFPEKHSIIDDRKITYTGLSVTKTGDVCRTYRVG